MPFTQPSITETKPSTIAAKLAALRLLLQTQKLDAYLIPSADEHLNEYLPAAKQRRDWLSGFTGSAGDFLVGLEQAWLFVDSRYYEQADQQTDPNLIKVVKLGLEDEETLETTLKNLGKATAEGGGTLRLGYDPFVLSINQFTTLQDEVEAYDIDFVPVAENLVDQVRSQQPWVTSEPIPAIAQSPLFLLPEALTGESVEQKLTRLREELQKQNIQILPITKLDQIAWLLNLRGWDISYNPVFIAYALLTPTQLYLFTNLERVEPAIKTLLQPLVTLQPYAAYADTLRSLVLEQPHCRVLLDPKHTTVGTHQLIQPLSCKVVQTSNPIEGMKARKNATEIAQMQQANLQASRAKTLTLKWLSEQLAEGKILTEADVAATIERYYAEENGFRGLSFNTIAGSGANSSVVHYGTPNPEAILKPGSLLLLDSGAQYASGTTDDTRTIAIGTPTSQQIERYTEVLKAHINCAMQHFPKGTTGAQLDGITRSTLWQARLDYGHGTGHGVGALLNVHEGPNGISKRVSEPLEPGMVTSVEPGFYEPGWGGIRIENLYVVRELPEPTEPGTEVADSTKESAKQPWYQLEALTYIPFDQKLIDVSQLSDRQRQWLGHYNQTIIEKLTPTLNSAEVAWLQKTCRF
jgi:Xaa-Pro aminopeptidase